MIEHIQPGLVRTAKEWVGVWRVGEVPSLGLMSDLSTLMMWDRLGAGISQLPRQATLHGVTRPLNNVTAELGGEGRWQRSVFLTVPFGESSPLSEVAAGLRKAFALSQNRPPAKNVEALQRQLDAVSARASDLDLTPVSTDEIEWLFGRVFTNQQHAHGATSQVRLREGFGAEANSRRWVSADNGQQIVYHAILAVEQMGDWMFPGGGQWWRSCDMLPFPVEWTVHLDLVPNHEARAQLRRRLSELDYQDEKESEVASAPRELVVAMAKVEEAIEELTEHSHSPLSRPTLLFWVSALTLGELEFRAETIRGLFEGADMTMVRPLGAQRKLLEAMVPGGKLPAGGRGWEQLIMPRDLASGLPVVAARVGDESGGFLGWQMLSGTVPVATAASDTAASRDLWTSYPVFFDAACGPRHNKSGAAAFIGDQGAGKSMTAKKLAHEVVRQGGRVVVYDPTEKGEWAQWARVVTDDPLVISIDGETAYDLDPLRIFADSNAAETYALGLLSLLTGTPATGVEASLLRAAIKQTLVNNGSLRDVPHELEASGSPEGSVLAADITTLLDTPVGRSLLSGTGRPVSSSEPVTVFRIPGLSLPTTEELSTEWGRRQLLPEQIMGQGVVYLIACVARELTMTDETFALGIMEEAYHIVRSSPQGRKLVLGWIRDSRKHNASVWLLSQSMRDLDEELRSLVSYRFVFRQGLGLATEALEWLGVPTTAEFQTLVERELLPGECLFHDLGRRVGLIQVDLPTDPKVVAAFSTTPLAVVRS